VVFCSIHLQGSCACKIICVLHKFWIMLDFERSQYVRSSLSEGDSFLVRQLARTAQHSTRGSWSRICIRKISEVQVSGMVSYSGSNNKPKVDVSEPVKRAKPALRPKVIFRIILGSLQLAHICPTTQRYSLYQSIHSRPYHVCRYPADALQVFNPASILEGISPSISNKLCP